jgi:hypothetical protein
LLIFLLYFFSCRMRIHWRRPLGLCQLILILSCYLLSMLLGGHLFRSLRYIFIYICLFASYIAYIWVAYSRKNIASIFASSLKGFAHIPAIFFLLSNAHSSSLCSSSCLFSLATYAYAIRRRFVYYILHTCFAS